MAAVYAPVTTYDAVLFDLDGTLCRRTQDTRRVYRQAFDRVGAAPFGSPDALWGALRGPPDHDDQVGYIGSAFARLAAQHGRPDVDPLAVAAAFTDLVDDSRVQLCQGALAALAAATAVGPIGLVTNGPGRRQRTKLDAVGITDRFAVRVYAGDLPRRKPHVEPFRRALESLGVAAEQTLYVGNSLAYDVAGAHNAGLLVAWLQDGDGPEPYEPDHVLESIGELESVLTDE